MFHCSTTNSALLMYIRMPIYGDDFDLDPLWKKKFNKKYKNKKM